MSSLIRLLKYYERGVINKGNAISSIVEIITQISSRGFNGYSDFKDQLDAVDLGLLPDDSDQIQYTALTTLYNEFNKTGDVL